MMNQQPIEDKEVIQLSPNSCHIPWLLAVFVTRKDIENKFKNTIE